MHYALQITNYNILSTIIVFKTGRTWPMLSLTFIFFLCEKKSVKNLSNTQSLKLYMNYINILILGRTFRFGI